VSLPDRPELGQLSEPLGVRAVTPNYLQLLGLPVLDGRTLRESDVAGADRVLVINQAAASIFWPGQRAVGRRIVVENVDWRVVGVVGDLRHRGPEDRVRPEGYATLAQADLFDGLQVVVRSVGEPTAVFPAVQAAVGRVASDQAVAPGSGGRLTLGDYLDAMTAGRRFNMILVAWFGGLGLVIAAVVVYGVVAYLVAQRTTEFGVRIALGATPRAIITLVGRGTLILIAIGVTLGLTAARLLGDSIRAFLFEIEPADVRITAAAVTVLAIAALTASVLPAWRAARTDPATTLRAE
jgi:hypothetical protein